MPITNTNSYTLFPTFPGLTWERNRAPQIKSLLQTTVSQLDSAVQVQSYPRYLYTLEYDTLRSGSPWVEWQTLLGFWNLMGGCVGRFLFNDWEDNAVTGQAMGAGDGTTKAFQLYRTLGGFTEPVLAANTITTVYLNGVAQSPSGISCADGLLTFTTAPASGMLISADFSFYWRCRFPEDTLDANMMAYQWWALKKLQIKTVLAGSG